MNRDHQYPKTPGAKLAKALAERGLRIFSRKDAISLALDIGYSESYASQIIHYLQKGEWIEVIRPGLYSLNPIFLGGTPIHKYEIASHLAKGAAISHFSAMQYHGFTDQIPQKIFITVTQSTNIPEISKSKAILIRGTEYQFTKTKSDFFFGHKKIWVGDVRVSITDLERTLLDGIIKPKYCGGIQEVLSAFEKSINELKVELLIKYATLLGKSTVKRLGWILDQLSISEATLLPLLDIPFKGYILLDSSGGKSGPYNKKWHIQENL